MFNTFFIYAKKYLFVMSIIIFNSLALFAQTLSGSYTIGGNNPDFATLQIAADALNANGVSGQVTFNIRPGTYFNNGGNNTVLLLDSTVFGLSAVNRITFQPDASSGGNVDNVIFLMHRTNIAITDRDLVKVGLDFITFRNLTFQNTDSLGFINNHLIRLEQQSDNLTVDDVVIENCKFIGTAFISLGGFPVGTDFGIGSYQHVGNLTIRNNIFIRLLRAVSVFNSPHVALGTITVEENEFYELYSSQSGSGNPLGAAIEVACTTAIIKRNLIDFSGTVNSGGSGIIVGAPTTAFIEQNKIKGYFKKGIYVDELLSVVPDSVLIANNFIAGDIVHPREGINCRVQNAKIVFNTVYLPPAEVNSTGLRIQRDNCKVFNNIIINLVSGNFAFGNGYDLNGVFNNIQSDYNIFFQIGGGAPFINNNTQFSTLEQFQTATGLDLNSNFKEIDFDPENELHLSDCQSQDPDLKGIPINGITVDIDGEIRNSITPMIGADENGFQAASLFGNSFRTELPGTAFSVASGKFDSDFIEGLAVTDYDNNKIYLYHNNGNRTFTQTGSIQTQSAPTIVKFFDFDNDTNLDLIVGYETAFVDVFWGNGLGGFTGPTTLATEFGRARSFEEGPNIDFNGLLPNTIWMTVDNGFLPNASVLQYITSRNSPRELFLFNNPRPGPPAIIDTIYTPMYDLAIGNLDENPDEEIAVISPGINVFVPWLLLFNDTTANGAGGLFPYGTHYEKHFNVGAHVGHQSNISINDFDNDGDMDIIATSRGILSSDSITYLKNAGNFNFLESSFRVTNAVGFVCLDYENDGDVDIVTMNERLEEKGLTVFLNDGTGNFDENINCFFPHASGYPYSITASDYDLDGKTDIAIVTVVDFGVDSLFVIYNLGGAVGIEDQEIENAPKTFSLEQNFPNPFNPNTTIQFSLPQSEKLSLTVFNLLGEKVKTLVEEYREAGNHSVQFNASQLASGIYFYRLQAGSFIETKKMILMK